VVQIDADAAPSAGFSADGSMVHLGVRRRRRLLEVTGVAVTGGRTLRPWDTLYRSQYGAWVRALPR